LTQHDNTTEPRRSANQEQQQQQKETRNITAKHQTSCNNPRSKPSHETRTPSSHTAEFFNRLQNENIWFKPIDHTSLCHTGTGLLATKT
jgi:hypothetical protein